MDPLLAPYLDRIRAWQPDLPIHTARLNRDGLINDVVIIDESLVVRFPKDDYGRRAMVQEGRVLDLARRHVAVRLPQFDHRGEDFVAYHFLPGEPLLHHVLLSQSAATQERLIGQLALFFRQLHAIPRDVADQHGIGASLAQRSREGWLEFYATVEQDLFPLLMPDARVWARQHFAPVIDGSLSLDYEPALMHGDLAAYHILYDPAAGEIAGVLDFGTAGLGDPAVDYAIVIAEFGESILRRMAAYNPDIPAALDRARFVAGTLELQWLLGGLRSNDLTWYACHIGRARDILPIGQPWR
jgi:aminoglycoside 2''-phosphotransferase